MNKLLTMILIVVVLYLLYDKYTERRFLFEKINQLFQSKENFTPKIDSMKLRIPKTQLKELFSNSKNDVDNESVDSDNENKTEGIQSEHKFWESFNIANRKNSIELANAQDQLYEHMISNENADHYAAINQMIRRQKNRYMNC